MFKSEVGYFVRREEKEEGVKGYNNAFLEQLSPPKNEPMDFKNGNRRERLKKPTNLLLKASKTRSSNPLR